MRESVDADCALLVERLTKEGKTAQEIKDEEEEYVQREWRERFRDSSKEELINKYNTLQGRMKLCSKRYLFFQ